MKIKRFGERDAFDSYYRPDKESFLTRAGQDIEARRATLDAIVREPEKEADPLLWVKDGDSWVGMSRQRRRMGFLSILLVLAGLAGAAWTLTYPETSEQRASTIYVEQYP
jgi:hypothetical protein